MSTWTDRELKTIDHADELRISSSRADGTATRPGYHLGRPRG
jgi:hypothetical protein